MRHTVFISHSVQDKLMAEKLCMKLEENDLPCWIAPRNVLAGSSWSGAIIQAIAECRVLVFIFSSHSNQSQHVSRELQAAVDKGRPIIPFIIDAVRPSSSIEYYISSAQWVDASSGSPGPHLEKLVRNIRALLATTAANPQEHPMAFAQPSGEPGAIPVPVSQAPSSVAAFSNLTIIDYEKSLRVIENLLQKQQWALCIKESGDILLNAMVHLLKQLMDAPSDPNVSHNMAVQNSLKSQCSSFEDFDLAGIIQFYIERALFVELRKQLTSNLSKIPRIVWGKAIEWHQISQTAAAPYRLGEDAANQMAYWLKLFLYDCELAGIGPRVAPVSNPTAITAKHCPSCKEPLQKSTWKFCPECGFAIRVICHACHRMLAQDFKICPYCETRVPQRGVNEKDEAHRTKEEYRLYCTGAYLDGVKNARENELLALKRLELGLNVEEADAIERACAPQNVVEYSRIVEGVLVDDVITDVERGFLQKQSEKLNIDSWAAKEIEDMVVATKLAEMAKSESTEDVSGEKTT